MNVKKTLSSCLQHTLFTAIWPLSICRIMANLSEAVCSVLNMKNAPLTENRFYYFTCLPYGEHIRSLNRSRIVREGFYSFLSFLKTEDTVERFSSLTVSYFYTMWAIAVTLRRNPCYARAQPLLHHAAHETNTFL